MLLLPLVAFAVLIVVLCCPWLLLLLSNIDIVVFVIWSFCLGRYYDPLDVVVAVVVNGCVAPVCCCCHWLILLF